MRVFRFLVFTANTIYCRASHGQHYDSTRTDCVNLELAVYNIIMIIVRARSYLHTTRVSRAVHRKCPTTNVNGVDPNFQTLSSSTIPLDV